MLHLPQRRAFAIRDDFAAAVTDAFSELYARYQAEPVTDTTPDWANAIGAHSVSLPLKVVRENDVSPHAVASIVKHALEMGKSTILRIARVERDGLWIVFFEAK